MERKVVIGLDWFYSFSGCATLKHWSTVIFWRLLSSFFSQSLSCGLIAVFWVHSLVLFNLVISPHCWHSFSQLVSTCKLCAVFLSLCAVFSSLLASVVLSFRFALQWIIRAVLLAVYLPLLACDRSVTFLIWFLMTTVVSFWFVHAAFRMITPRTTQSRLWQTLALLLTSEEYG